MAKKLLFNPADVKRFQDEGKKVSIIQMHIIVDDEGNPVIFNDGGTMHIKGDISGTVKIPNLGIGKNKDTEMTEEFNKIKKNIIKQYFPGYEIYELRGKFSIPAKFEKDHNNEETIAFMITLAPTEIKTDGDIEIDCHEIQIVSDTYKVVCEHNSEGTSWFRFTMAGDKTSVPITGKKTKKRSDNYIGNVGMELQAAQYRKTA